MDLEGRSGDVSAAVDLAIPSLSEGFRFGGPPPRSAHGAAATVAEIGEFWDTHGLADHWDETRDVDLEVRAERRRRVTLAPDVYSQIETQAQRQGILPETLVTLWLLERLQQAS